MSYYDAKLSSHFFVSFTRFGAISWANLHDGSLKHFALRLFREHNTSLGFELWQHALDQNPIEERSEILERIQALNMDDGRTSNELSIIRELTYHFSDRRE